MRRIYLALLGSLVQPGLATAKTYQVQRGDTLGQIAKTHVGSPVWGDKGSVKKLLELNPDIKDPNQIFVNQTINLSPEAEVSQAEADPVPAAAAEAPAETEPSPVVAAEETPAPVPEAESSSSTSSSSTFAFKVEGLVSTTNIDAEARDKSFETSPDSKINQGLRLGVSYRLTEKSTIEADAAFVKSRFADSKDGRLNGDDKVLKSFELSYQYRLLESLQLSVGAETEQVYFVGQLAPQKFQIEPIFVDSVKLGLSYDILVAGDWTWNVKGDLYYAFAADGDYSEPDSGAGQDISTALAYRINPSFDVLGGVFFERRHQGSNLVQQINTDNGATLGIVFRK